MLFIKLPSGASWGADPRGGKGSGTIDISGTTGGTLNLHLASSSGAASLDVAGTYACNSSLKG